MSHTTIYFLTEAEDIEEAQSKVDSYLETEHFFDYYTVLPESSGLLSQKRKELREFIKDWDWKKAADNLLVQAEKHKEAGNTNLFGSFLIDAGTLYAQCLAIDTYVFNIETGDYTVPDDDSGWWVIEADFHY
jgi:hypothetical protein